MTNNERRTTIDERRLTIDEERRVFGHPLLLVTHYSLLITIILLAFFLRLWQLPDTPPGLWYDEAYNAIDAMWMVETGDFQPFVVGNNGRETMWHVLLIPSISGLGNTPFAVRLVGSLVGVITIPVMYRFALALAGSLVENRRERRWFALAAAAWVAVSWWHLHNSRAGFRPVLLPPVLMLSLYFYWRGWRRLRQTGRLPLGAMAGAGLFLGLAQYTYLPARLVPLIFGGLTLLWSLPLVRSQTAEARWPALGRWWGGAALTALAAALVFGPLGYFFWQNPELFSARTGDVVFVPDTALELLVHVLQSLSFFFGAGHELYRHHLPGRAMLGWLEIPFFWVGLAAALRAPLRRQPAMWLVLLGLGVMWLPAGLASPPAHSLRPIGLLPFYYLLVTLGLYRLARFVLAVRQPGRRFQAQHFLIAGLIFVGASATLNSYDYFWRWRTHPEVYKEYNGPLVDLTGQLAAMTGTQDVIIPFHLYAHPTLRYLLRPSFTEMAGAAPPLYRDNRPLRMMLTPNTFQLLYVANIPESPALALLTRNAAGQGQVYVSRPPRAGEQAQINGLLAAVYPQAQPFIDRLGRTVAQFAPLPVETSQADSILGPLFSQTDPLRTITLTWADQAQLIGYDVTPLLIEPNKPLTLNLYWRSLTDHTFDQRLFLQIINSAGEPITQWEGNAFAEDMYRWRPAGLMTTQHTLWIGPDTPPGPYLVRLGFFDRHTGARLPLATASAGDQPVDQAQIGLFFVTPTDVDPRIPASPLDAIFADTIKLTGVTLPDLIHDSQLTIHNSPLLPVTFHWQPTQPIDKPYTVFLQLLDENGAVISGWDSQPFSGLYPTHRWSPGETITDTFLLPLPEGDLPPGQYRLITGFYDFETGQRLQTGAGSDFAELARFRVN